MKRAICDRCNNIMKVDFIKGEQVFFCKRCKDYSQYQIKEVVNYCDRCNEKLEVIQGCASTSFFCNNCNEIRSKSRVKRVIKSK